jgi:hypothetical protein
LNYQAAVDPCFWGNASVMIPTREIEHIVTPA